MFIEKQDFLLLDAKQCQVYFYFCYNQSMTIGQTEPMLKQDIVDELKISSPTLNTAINELLDLNFIDIVSEPREPLRVRLVDRKLDRLLKGYDVSEALEPDDDDGAGEFEPSTPLDY